LSGWNLAGKWGEIVFSPGNWVVTGLAAIRTWMTSSGDDGCIIRGCWMTDKPYD